MYKLLRCLPQIHLICFIFKMMQNLCICVDTNNDAKMIVDSKFNPKTIEEILLYRTQDECIAINKAIEPLNGGKPLIDPKHIPVEGNKPYDDLLFALVNDSMTVFSMYLGYYLDQKDETFIIMIFVQIDDREKLKQVFGDQHGRSFDEAREKQRHPFQNALRVWAEKNRDPDKGGCLSDACLIGEELEDDRPNWNKNRDKLEYVLMKQSISDSQNSVHCYGTLYECIQVSRADFVKDITRTIDNHDLVDLYTTLVRYLENGDTYLAQVLHDHCDGKDNWSMWIVILTTRRGNPMKAIDEAFQSQYKNVTLKDYIKTCNVEDPQLKNMLAILVDSSSVSKRQPPPPPPPPPSQPPPQPSPFDYSDGPK